MAFFEDVFRDTSRSIIGQNQLKYLNAAYYVQVSRLAIFTTWAPGTVLVVPIGVRVQQLSAIDMTASIELHGRYISNEYAK